MHRTKHTQNSSQQGPRKLRRVAAFQIGPSTPSSGGTESEFLTATEGHSPAPPPPHPPSPTPSHTEPTGSGIDLVGGFERRPGRFIVAGLARRRQSRTPDLVGLPAPQQHLPPTRRQAPPSTESGEPHRPPNQTRESYVSRRHELQQTDRSVRPPGHSPSRRGSAGRPVHRVEAPHSLSRDMLLTGRPSPPEDIGIPYEEATYPAPPPQPRTRLEMLRRRNDDYRGHWAHSGPSSASGAEAAREPWQGHPPTQMGDDLPLRREYGDQSGGNGSDISERGTIRPRDMGPHRVHFRFDGRLWHERRQQREALQQQQRWYRELQPQEQEQQQHSSAPATLTQAAEDDTQSSSTGSPPVPASLLTEAASTFSPWSMVSSVVSLAASSGSGGGGGGLSRSSTRATRASSSSAAEDDDDDDDDDDAYVEVAPFSDLLCHHEMRGFLNFNEEEPFGTRSGIFHALRQGEESRRSGRSNACGGHCVGRARGPAAAQAERAEEGAEDGDEDEERSGLVWC